MGLAFFADPDRDLLDRGFDLFTRAAVVVVDLDG